MNKVNKLNKGTLSSQIGCYETEGEFNYFFRTEALFLAFYSGKNIHDCYVCIVTYINWM